MIHASREDWLKLRVGIEQENLNCTVSHSNNNAGTWFGPSGVMCNTGDFKSTSKPFFHPQIMRWTTLAIMGLKHKNTSQMRVQSRAQTPGHPGRGGYNLETALGWNQKLFTKFKKYDHALIDEHLDVSKCASAQNTALLKIVQNKATNKFPDLENYARCWPVTDFIMMQLKYMSGHARRQELEMAAGKSKKCLCKDHMDSTCWQWGRHLTPHSALPPLGSEMNKNVDGPYSDVSLLTCTDTSTKMLPSWLHEVCNYCVLGMHVHHSSNPGSHDNCIPKKVKVLQKTFSNREPVR
ncbi:hypothetical protein BS17DRAFT_763344 [Gyrodon lividus]|nr:hypothetical protein BS17DRAFT_763344 [Gyrodon lividus]